MIQNILGSMPPEQQDEFMRLYEQQRNEDAATLRRWASTHRPAADEYVS